MVNTLALWKSGALAQIGSNSTVKDSKSSLDKGA